MPKSDAFPLLICLYSLTLLIAGCKRQPPETTEPLARPSYFKTAFQDESQFIVESIVSDLAQETYYAARQQRPDKREFQTIAIERRGTIDDSPIYDVRIKLDSKTPELVTEIKIDGPIWSPMVYREVTAKLAQTVGLTVVQPGTPVKGRPMPKLTDSTAETIEREDQAVSSLLEKDFRNPEAHERAAMLLGFFLFRDHSGHFLEIRTPLSRLTAHLALARFLRGTELYGLDGQIAEATLLTVINSEKLALERLNSIPTNHSEVAALVRTLRCRATGDYRTIGQLKDGSPIERVEYFCSKSGYVGTPSAWLDLSEGEKQIIDFVRTAHHQRYSVEIGHELFRSALGLEMGEINSIYELTHQDKLKPGDLVEALNELPDGCFRTDPAGKTRVQVIGWGQWAFFLQRHLCHAIQQDYHFLSSMLGVPEDAKQFAAESDRIVAGLRLYPFVRRFNCSNVEEYHKSVDDGFAVTAATPQLVPADCWNYLCAKVRFAPLYSPIPNPHINSWFRHDPPPGTAYDLNPRLYHSSLSEDPDGVARLEKLHELAPYDARISDFIVKTKYHGHPTYDQATALYSAELPYSVVAMRTVAGTMKDQPEQYEKLMLRAAELDPASYYDLGDYFIGRNQEEKGAKYIDQACDRDPDAVRVSNCSVWRVQHCFRTGQIDKAGAIADAAADVYSARGLEAKAIYLEGTTNYDGAFEWFSKMEERYGQSDSLLSFCLRYESQIGDHRFAPEVKKRLGKLFPKGLETVSLNNFHAAPTDGVLIRQENDLLKASGLKAGDVIVAAYGTRVHNFLQYLYERDSRDTAELNLIAWTGKDYHELAPSPPHHRFGVEFDNYVPQNGAGRSTAEAAK